MNKIQKHTITLDSPRSDAADNAQHELESLEAQTTAIKAAALKGNLSADALAAHTDRVNLATLRAEATRTAADEELANLSTPNNIADAIAELLDDPALSTDGIEQAVSSVRAAIEAVDTANTERNTAISAWVAKLRQLGIPDNGLTVNDDEIHIQSSGPTGTTITIGAGRITTIGSTAEYLRHITQQRTSSARMALDPSNISRADTRGRARAEVTSIRLLRDLGSYKEGAVLTNRNHTIGVLAKYVHDGHAELIDGQIPEESQYKRSFIPGDTSRLPDWHHVTNLSNVHDAAEVQEAVTAVFRD